MIPNEVYAALDYLLAEMDEHQDSYAKRLRVSLEKVRKREIQKHQQQNEKCLVIKRAIDTLEGR